MKTFRIGKQKDGTMFVRCDCKHMIEQLGKGRASDPCKFYFVLYLAVSSPFGSPIKPCELEEDRNTS